MGRPITLSPCFVSLTLLVGLPQAAHGQCTPVWTAYDGPSLSSPAFALTTWDPDGAGPEPAVVVAGGNFQSVGSTTFNYVGMWNGSVWQRMGSGLGGGVRAAALYDPDGAGPQHAQPVAGGYFTHSGSGQPASRVARFDGSDWTPFGEGVGGWGGATIYSLTGFNHELVVGGLFSTAGGALAGGIARWDGSRWLAFVDERAGNPNALATINGVLYAGGSWPIQPGNPPLINGIWQWNDPAWVTVGGDYLQAEVFAITTYRGQLAVGGGWFVATFDGTDWHMLGPGIYGYVYALCPFDPDGPGPMPELLIAGGSFTEAGGQPASGIAAWDGTSWMPLGQGTTGSVRALTVWNGKLVAAGEFFTAGGLVSPGMAFWGCPEPPCYPNCDSSTAPPTLNVSDFVCFINRFAAGDPYANCDGSTSTPALNVADFVCYMNSYAAGCR